MYMGLGSFVPGRKAGSGGEGPGLTLKALRVSGWQRLAVPHGRLVPRPEDRHIALEHRIVRL